MVLSSFRFAGMFAVLLASFSARAQSPSSQPLPDIPKLMHEVMDHQKKLEKVRESYTYSSTQTVQDIDANGKVKKTESSESENFFVNGHAIERTVKKNGKPLNEHDQQKETERITKLVQKAEKTPPGQPLQGQTISISRAATNEMIANANALFDTLSNTSQNPKTIVTKAIIRGQPRCRI